MIFIYNILVSGNLLRSCSNTLKLSSQKISTSSLIFANEENQEGIKEPSTWFSNFLGYTQNEDENKVRRSIV